MHDILNLEKFPLDRKGSHQYNALIERCQRELEENGMFDLDQFVRPEIAQRAADLLADEMATNSFTHARQHNIYFKKDIPGLAPDHPALQECETVNHTLCADQLTDNPVLAVYEWEPLRDFLAKVMGKSQLYLMDDPLARANVMMYDEGEALNWHFDRSEFTITLLLQAPDIGGEFEYRTNLRTDENPNYEGVARLLRGEDSDAKRLHSLQEH